MRRFTLVGALLLCALALTAPQASASCHTHRCWHKVHAHRVLHLVEARRAAIDPYRCYGDRFAIPCWYISHESATSGLWRAVNPGGCIGAYQFCGWQVPWPVIVPGDRLETERRKLAHDRLARRLPRGSWCCY